MRLPFKKIEFDILLAISVITIIVVILTSVAGYSRVSADTSAKLSKASSWITWIVCLSSTIGVIYMAFTDKGYGVV